MSISTSSRARTTHLFGSVSMDTHVSVQVVAAEPRLAIEPAVRRGMGWFSTVERICTRFDRTSEVMRLIDHAGEPTRVSTLLFQVVSFALQLAEQTDGAFDPTIGASLEQLGFNVNYITGEAIQSGINARNGDFRDVRLDAGAQTILLRRPLILDLNSVAKGLAIDLAARELEGYADVCVEAGGDVFVRGRNAAGEPWRVGIQHPRAAGVLAHTLEITDAAVCTSGDYERRASGPGQEGHILDARTGQPVGELASVTVVADTAMAADGLSTAAMVLGRQAGATFLESQGVGGVLISPEGTAKLVNL